MKSEYSALSLAAAGTSAANCVLHTSATSRDEPFLPTLFSPLSTTTNEHLRKRGRPRLLKTLGRVTLLHVWRKHSLCKARKAQSGTISAGIHPLAVFDIQHR